MLKLVNCKFQWLCQITVKRNLLYMGEGGAAKGEGLSHTLRTEEFYL